MSELTVPRAGVQAGRAAEVRVEASSIGSSVAQLGEVASRVGTALENDRLDRELNRHSVDLTNDMNNAMLGLSQIGDPDELEAAFTAQIGALKQSYLKPVEEGGRPRVDVKNQERFNLVFDELSGRNGAKIGDTALARRQGQRLATFMEYEQVATVAAGQADPEVRETLYDQGVVQINQLEQNGILSPEQAAAKRITLRGDLDKASAIQLINDDPVEFIEAVDDGEYDGLDGSTLSQYRVSAQNKIDARIAKDAKDLENLAKANAKIIDDRLTQMSGIWDAGQRAVDEDEFLKRPDVQSHPRFAQAMAQKQILDETPALDMMTVDQLSELVADEKSRPKAYKFQAERLSILEDKLEAEETAWAADPIQYARDKGFQMPGLPVFDPDAPDDFTQGLKQLKHFSTALVENGWSNNDAVLSEDDVAQLKSQIQDQTDPAAKAAMAKSVMAAFGDRPDVTKLVSGDPVFQYVGALQLNAASPRLGAEIISGQQSINNGTVILPPIKDRLAPTFDAVETLFLDIPGGSQIQSDVMAAADALYGSRMGRVDPTDDINSDVYSQALHEVLGGTGAYGSRRAKGGVQEVGDVLTMLPKGVSAETVETAISSLGKSQVSRRKRSSGEQHPTLIDDLKSISTSGKAPSLGGVSIDERTLSQMNIRAVRDGVYEFFHIDNAGRVLVPNDEDGMPYRFLMKSLLKGRAK